MDRVFRLRFDRRKGMVLVDWDDCNAKAVKQFGQST
jgi:hypothetical protein